MPGLETDSGDDFSRANQRNHSPPRQNDVAPATSPVSTDCASSRPKLPSACRGQPAQVSGVSQQHVAVDPTGTQPTTSSAAATSSRQASAFRLGIYVRVIGLRQRTDMNGCPGYVCGEMEKDCERWPVEVMKGPNRVFETVMLRGVNMTVLGNLDDFDPGSPATCAQELVLKDPATSEVDVRSQIRAQRHPWHRAALHLIGHKFYCSVRPKIEHFIIGFDMRVGVKNALANNDACVQSGLPLIFDHFGEIAFGADEPEDLFTMYFQVLPAALRNLPWNCHKFSIDPPVSDFKSVPLSCDTFCSTNLVMVLSQPQSPLSIIFNRRGFEIAASSPSPQIDRAPEAEAAAQPPDIRLHCRIREWQQQHLQLQQQQKRPSPEGIACLMSNIRGEIQSKSPTMNQLLYR
jgi:hypothetical protein